MCMVYRQDNLILLCQQLHLHGARPPGHRQSNTGNIKGRVRHLMQGKYRRIPWNQHWGEIKWKDKTDIATDNWMHHQLCQSPLEHGTTIDTIIFHQYYSTWHCRSAVWWALQLEISHGGSQLLGEEHQDGYCLHNALIFPLLSRDTIIHLAKYLKAMRMQGIMLDPGGNKRFEFYADANFCGNWHHPNAYNNPSTAKSCTGYSVQYNGCPIIRCSNLQTQNVLSTTEVEHMDLSQSLRDAGAIKG